MKRTISAKPPANFTECLEPWKQKSAKRSSVPENPNDPWRIDQFLKRGTKKMTLVEQINDGIKEAMRSKNPASTRYSAHAQVKNLGR